MNSHAKNRTLDRIEEFKNAIKVMEAFLKEKPILVKSKHQLDYIPYVSENPLWDWENYEYAIKLDPPSIDWSIINPEWKWFAFSSYGVPLLFTSKPELNKSTSNLWSMYDSKGKVIPIPMLSNVQRGTVPWQETLTRRPDTDHGGN